MNRRAAAYFLRPIFPAEIQAAAAFPARAAVLLKTFAKSGRHRAKGPAGKRGAGRPLRWGRNARRANAGGGSSCGRNIRLAGARRGRADACRRRLPTGGEVPAGGRLHCRLTGSGSGRYNKKAKKELEDKSGASGSAPSGPPSFCWRWDCWASPLPRS